MTDIWDDMFGDIHKEFEKMMDIFGKSDFRMHGFTSYTGPDGIPRVHEFGTEMDAGVPADGVREPLTDVCVDGNLIRIVVELPGVKKEDIQLEGTETSMTVSVETETRKFRKTVPLPSAVDQDSAKAEYNNGILEVTVASKEKKPESRKISVE